MTTRPNVLLVVLDTTRALDVAPVAPSVTPVLAELGEQGTTYTNAFTSAPWTLPSHASLFTGTYTSRHGAHGDHPELDGDLRTLAEVFQDAGYDTAGISNNTWVAEEFGLERGFETYYRTWQRVDSKTDAGELRHADGVREKARRLRKLLADGDPLATLVNVVYDQFEDRHGDDGAAQTTDWIGDWVENRKREDPFFLFANYLEPHLSYRPPRSHATSFLPEGWSYDEAMAISQDPRPYDVGKRTLSADEAAALRGLYRGELAYLDEQLGRLRQRLIRSGEWEDTVVVVTGDHGENLGDYGHLGHQYSIADTLLHVPLVVCGGAFDGGGVDDALVQPLDLAPTLLDATGVQDSHARRQFQGRSFHPDADTSPRTRAVAEYVAPQPPVSTLEEHFEDLPPEVKDFDRTLRAIRTDEWKLVRASDGTLELYDVSGPPTATDETDDCARVHPDVGDGLEADLEEWLTSFDGTTASGEVSMTDATEQRLTELGYLQ